MLVLQKQTQLGAPGSASLAIICLSASFPIIGAAIGGSISGKRSGRTRNAWGAGLGAFVGGLAMGGLSMALTDGEALGFRLANASLSAGLLGLFGAAGGALTGKKAGQFRNAAGGAGGVVAGELLLGGVYVARMGR